MDRPRRAIGRFLNRRLPRRARAVFDAYGRIGGGILADGLAYNALFALLPALLLVVSVVGFVVRDANRQAQIVDAIAAYVPPLRDLLGATLHAMANGAVQVSIVSVVTLIWGAGQFARALEGSFGRVFSHTPERGLVRRSILGVASVVLLIAAVVIVLGLASVASLVLAGLGDPNSTTDLGRLGLLNPLATAVVSALGVASVYRFMPARRPRWRSIRVPALAVGVGVALFTQLFAFIAPRLIGIAMVYGTIAVVFATLAWLSIVSQVLLIGLVWVRFREEGWPEPGPRQDP